MPAVFRDPIMDPRTQRIWTVSNSLRAAVDQIEEGVVFLETESSNDGGPRVVFVNRGLSALTGFRGEDLLGCPLSTLFEGEKLEFLLARLTAIADSGRVYEIEAPIQCAGGGELPCRWKVSCVPGEDGEPLNFLLTAAKDVPDGSVERVGNSAIGVNPEGAVPLPPGSAAPGDDIQVEVLGEKQVSPCSEEELRADRIETLALLAGGTAHEFKNVLTPVKGNLSLALEQIGDGELRDWVQDAAKAAESCCDMAMQLLHFAEGRGKGERIDADVGRLLHEAAKLSTFGSKAHCEITTEDSLWSAEIDVTQITQVINNLIINARQAMDDVGTVQAKLSNREIAAGEVDELPAGKYLCLEVTDHGCGIPADKLDAIFNPFYTTKDTGNGLGLATCQTVMRDHGGVIDVESEIGRGSKFSVYIPATGRTDAAAGSKEDTKVVDGSGTILVVDDQSQVRAVTTALLKRLGYDCLSAETGEEAVATFRRCRSEARTIDAVLMDLTLPGGIDGSEATAAILEIDPEAKVIACSGYIEGSMTDKQRNSGFVEILSKPYDLKDISKCLHGVLSHEEYYD